MMKHCHSCWWFKRWYICSCPVSISWNGFVVVFFRMLLFWKVFRCICQHFCRFSGKSRLVFFWTFIDLFWCGGHWWEKNLLCSLESWLLLCKALWGKSEKPSVSASCKMLIHPCFSTMWWLQWGFNFRSCTPPQDHPKAHPSLLEHNVVTEMAFNIRSCREGK